MKKPEPSEIEAFFKNAEHLRARGKQQEAISEYTKVVYFAPRHWPAYFHLGVLFGVSGHNELAIALLERAAALNPENAVIQNHIGDILMKLSRNNEALDAFKKSWSLDLSAGNLSAAGKAGKLLREMNRPEAAIEYFDHVLSYKDDDKANEDLKNVSRWLRGLCRMALGNYPDAWKDYQSRIQLPGVITPDLPGEQWQGQALQGKTIFLAYEQRFGDVIQFLRFIPRLTGMGARVIVQSPPELERQLHHCHADMEVVSLASALPDYDYHQLLTNIPAVLNLDQDDIAADTAPYLYIKEPGENANLPMRLDTQLKVGLIWSGKPEPDRSIPLAIYIPLLRHRHVSFFSYQLGANSGDLQANAVNWIIHDLSPRITDFYDSSVLLKEMDLLITIDTAAAHQAGALGIPVWLMLRYFSDWRWMINRDDNAWYPTMRLFRQECEGSWDAAGKQLETAFASWVAHSIKLPGRAGLSQ